MRGQHRARGLRRARRQGRVARPRRGRLPRGRRRHLQGPGKGQVRAADRQGALHGAAVGRGRHSVAQHHLDDEPRHRARPRFRRPSPTTTARASWCARGSAVKSAKELDGATVCVQTGTTTELNLADYFRTNNMKYKPVVFEKLDEVDAAYLLGRCDAYTTDVSQLYAAATASCPSADDHVVLPDDHLQGAAGTRGAPGRRPVGRHRALVAVRDARGRGVRHHARQRRRDARTRQIRRSAPPRRAEGDSARASASTRIGSFSIVKAVGNYGESFERNVGTGSPPQASRAASTRCGSKGGLQYAPPIR